MVSVTVTISRLVYDHAIKLSQVAKISPESYISRLVANSIPCPDIQRVESNSVRAVRKACLAGARTVQEMVGATNLSTLTVRGAVAQLLQGAQIKVSAKAGVLLMYQVTATGEALENDPTALVDELNDQLEEEQLSDARRAAKEQNGEAIE